MSYKHKLPSDTSENWQANGYSGWRPTMAMPYFVGFGLKKSKCGCGKTFKSQEEYEAHYLYQAIWKLESKVLPVEWKNFYSTKSQNDN